MYFKIDYADRQFALAEIEKRHASQLGMGIPFNNNFGIQTSVISIHTFLANFLKFYECTYFFNLDFYKDEFLKLINLPYGYNQRTRLKILQNYSS